LNIPNPKVKPDSTVPITVDVQNTGNLAGDEVVQLYIRDVEASTTRPIQALKGFKRISLLPGGRKIAHFELTPEDLSMLKADGKWGVEPGKFEVMVGASSEDIRLRGEFEVVD
jgi:beta-glucosidase